MIETEVKPDRGVVVVKAVGEITADDYQNSLVPGLEKAIAEHGPVRMLYWFGSDFTGFSPGAMWADMKLGLSHMKDIKRIAIVSDHSFINGMVHSMSWLLPMPVRLFADDEIGEANSWLVSDNAE